MTTLKRLFFSFFAFVNCVRGTLSKRYADNTVYACMQKNEMK
jgi:hypothetical protein